MPNIRCAACGKRYDYHQNGCCPRCGAYNRPPRREWVAADGSVHHGSARPEKVCYEKKVCFEDQARKPKKKPAPQAASAPQTPPKPRPTGGKSQNNSIAIAIVAIVLLFAIMLLRNTGLLDHSTWDHNDWATPDWSDTDWDNSDQDTDPEPVPPDDNSRNIVADCGDMIDIDDLTIQFLGYVSADDGQVYVLYWTNDNDLARSLLESGSTLLWSETGGFACPADEVGDGFIYFNTFSPGTQWQTLTISDSTAGNITIHSLLPHEGADLPDYNLPTTAYPA